MPPNSLTPLFGYGTTIPEVYRYQRVSYISAVRRAPLSLSLSSDMARRSGVRRHCSSSTCMMRNCLLAALLGLAATAEVVEVDDDTQLMDGEYIYREFVEGPEDCEMEEEVDDDMYVSIHYIGMIDNTSSTGVKGSVFHSTRVDNKTFDYRVGHEQAIAAFDEGLVGICAGAKITLTVPSEAAYGRKGVLEKDGRQQIPGYATVRFEIEVVRVSEDPPPPENLFARLDVDEDKHLSKDEVSTPYNFGHPS